MMNPVEFNKTTFYQGLNATYGKIPVKLEVYLDFQEEGNLLKLGFSIGIDKMYRVSDIGHFLEALEELHPYYFSKKFIFEPAKMYFEKIDQKIVEFLYNLKTRQKYDSLVNDPEKLDLHTNEVVLPDGESERFLDLVWHDLGSIRQAGQGDKLSFVNDINIKLALTAEPLTLIMDYTEYGDFEPVVLSFRYIIFKNKKMIVKLPERKREVFINLYKFKNEENIVAFRINEYDKKFFRKNFLEKYSAEFKISMDDGLKKALTAESLLTRTYFDVAPKGIIAKIEFCYGDKIINPLDDTEADKSFRELDGEKGALAELEFFGFREFKRLFLLDDVEKIMYLLTDKLAELKKVAEVYYSEDFKKLYVKNVSSLGLTLSEDDSMIHMNINMENVSDEELAEILDAMKRGKKYYRLRNGAIINLASVESSKLVNLINSLDIDKNSINGGIFEIPLNKCLYIDNYLKEKGVEDVEISDSLGGLIKRVSKAEEAEFILEEPLKGVLRNYQAVGVKWLKTMANYSFGGILADDMGLGKTLQVLAFIAGEKNRKLSALVVAPTSIVYNWQREAEKFVPHLKVLVVTGTKDKRTLLIYRCMEYDLVVTSYGALKNDVQDYQKIKFSYIFVDEAQNIKNPLTLNANSVKSLKAKCCFALTGTPIENRLTEIWSIFDFIMPGYLFDRKKFIETYEEAIIKEKNRDKMNELSCLIRPFIIRRLKQDVLSELPEKIETNFISPMTDKQRKLYAAYYKDVKNELMVKINESGMERNRLEILAALTRLRQICAHPGTFLADYDGGSGKLDLAMEIMTEAVNSGHSVLLFSQFTKMLKIIRDELEYNNINYYYLDGSMTQEERIMEIDNFNSDREAVFLISLKAGGTGLNLTKADIIIHFDPWWNPAVEDQASDRAHRIGQKNVVQVYKLLTEGTIEEKIAQLQERKRNLIGSIIKPGENFFNRFGDDEIRELFGNHEDDSR